MGGAENWKILHSKSLQLELFILSKGAGLKADSPGERGSCLPRAHVRAVNSVAG